MVARVELRPIRPQANSLCYKEPQANSLCYKEPQANSLCYKCKLIFGFYYKKGKQLSFQTEVTFAFLKHKNPRRL